MPEDRLRRLERAELDETARAAAIGVQGIARLSARMIRRRKALESGVAPRSTKLSVSAASQKPQFGAADGDGIAGAAFR
ncbi:MAG TPA: hypothetical protein VGH36_02545 [Acetobacteraceae bacterium]